MEEYVERLCCDPASVNLSEANRLQRDLPQLIRLFYVLSREMLGALDITILQSYILMGLQVNGPMTMTEISDYTKLAASTVTRVADKLVKANLTERTCDERDRRVVCLKLSESGEARSTQIRTLQNVFFQGLLSGLSALERESIVSGLALLTGRLAQFADQRHDAIDVGEDLLVMADTALA